MNTGNSKKQKKKFTKLLEWAEDVKFSGTPEMKTMVSDMLEAWLSTDYASRPEKRSAFLVDSLLLQEGLSIINTFKQKDFDQMQSLIKG